MGVIVEYDSEAEAIYLRIQDDAEVTETLSLSDLVMADVDPTGKAVGIEILKAPTDITPGDLRRVFDRFPELQASASSALLALGIRPA